MNGIIDLATIILLILMSLAVAVFAAALFLDAFDRKELRVFIEPTPRGVKIFLVSMLGIGTIIFIVSIIYEFAKMLK